MLFGRQLLLPPPAIRSPHQLESLILTQISLSPSIPILRRSDPSYPFPTALCSCFCGILQGFEKKSSVFVRFRSCSSCRDGLVVWADLEVVMKALFVFLIQVWLLSRSADGSMQRRELARGFRCSEMEYIDNNGLFLLSNSSTFAFGFTLFGDNSTAFLLSVVHLGSSTTVVWSANRGKPVSNSDDFVFDKDGNAYLQSGDAKIWSTDTHGKGVTRIELLDSGNLVFIGDGGASDPIWQSFDHPTDTLLSDQSFAEGMSLESDPSDQGLKYQLRIESGDAKLFAQFQSPQPYWLLSSDPMRIENKVGGSIHTAVLNSNSWNFYDKNQTLICQIIVNSDSSGNDTLAAVLDKSGFILFSSLPSSGQPNSLPARIPKDPCNAPEHCHPYFICSSGGGCQCPTVLSSSLNCDPGMASSCDMSASVDLVKVGNGVGYFATDFISPSLVSNLTGCRDACLNNCSCVALFHDGSSGNCFHFDQIGSFKQIQGNSSSSTFIKVQSNADGGNGSNGQGSSANKPVIIVVVISVLTVCVIVVLIFLALRIHRRRKKLPEPSQGSSEEDNFLESISGMPVRFSYRELQEATENFSVKLGEGGFGSVYLGKLPDNTRVAVKKLEGIGQGKKEFRSEVTIIGSIHHIHLVKLRGFCAEGAHRLLAYEYMAKGSLDRWIFKSNEEDDELVLDWDKRYNIALGTAKGLAYLHEDCESRIIHCDIKPENVLLDDNFLAKVSDFGLAKLMTREQSHVFTTLRGTRGYLAPEWITNYAISEKSDVYSYGMVLLEIIGGRKNFDPAEGSEKAHFPSYAFKKMEEGKLMEVFDAKLRDNDARMDAAIKVALWCIQEDLHLRPSMMKVVQMLEGLQEVPQPPVSSQLGFRLYANAFKSISEEGTYSGSGPSSDCNSDAFLSAVRLSGPR